MLRNEGNSCVDCTSVGLYCLGSGCRNAQDRYCIVCDECGEDDEDEGFYEVDGKQLCAACVLKRFNKIDIEDLLAGH